MIKRSVPRYSQPQYPVRPNRQFSTLRSALLPIQGNGRMVDVCASRTFTYGTNIAESVFVKGKYTGNTADGTSTIQAEGACQYQTFSRIAIVKRNFDTGGSGTISDSRIDSAALGAQWFISGSEIGLNKAADTAIGASTGAGITTGVEYVVGVTYDGTTAKFYIDGRAVGSGTAAVSFVLSGTGVLFSRGGGGSEQLNGYIGLHADFEGALPDSVMQSLTANPWQIFEDRKQNIYVSAASSGTTVSVPAGTLTITGYTPTVATSDHKTVSVPAGSLTLSGFAPTVSASSGTTIAVPAGSLTLTGYAPVIVNPHTISIPLATLSLTGYAPTVLAGVTVSVPAGSLSLTGYAPTVINPVSISIPAGSLTLSGFAPTVSNGAGITISVQNATLALTGFAPAVAIESMWRTVSASGGVWVDASAASGTWTEV